MIDQDARDLAVHDHKTTFLVEAAAGTGKTTLTVQRILALIQSGVRVERIAAVTFTVKAAGELKERLRSALAEKRESEWANDALNHLDHMAVNTIHGFCSDLLRALPVEARLEPGFHVTDELEQAAMQREFWNTWLHDALNGETPNELDLFLEFADLSPRRSEFGPTRVCLYDLFEALLGASSLSLPDDAESVGRYHLENRRRALLTVLERASAAIPSCTDETDKLLPHIVRVSQLSDKIPDSLCSWDALQWLDANKGIGAVNVGRAGAWTGAVDVASARQIVLNARDAIAEIRKAVFSIALEAVLRWMLPAAAQYRQFQIAQGRVGFDDLLRATRDMLRESRTARRIFKSQFSFLHIDEFQDTDPIQTEILFYLAEEEGSFAPEWRDVVLEPGKLFVVGDPKQSIYRFRGADLRIYNEAKAKIAQSGKALQIRTNFRSDDKLLGEVNAIFRQVIQGGSDDAPEYVSLSADSGNPSSRFAVEILTPEVTSAKQTAPDAAQFEAEAIVSHIKGALSRDILVGKQSQKRPLALRDMAILLRTGRHLEALTSALRAADIPYVSYLNDAFMARTEIESALTLLSALSNPQDTMSVVGVLRSPWFGIADDELLLHRYGNGAFVFTNPQHEDTKIGQALTRLRVWHDVLHDRTPSALLEYVIGESHAPTVYGMKSQGAARYHNLSRLIGVMRRLERNGETRPMRILERLRSMNKLADAVDAESHSPADAVRILTIHKAKGLEFPFVYVYRLAPSEKKSSILISAEGGVARLAVSSGGTSSHGYEELAQREKERQSHEELRCLYVAMTRACDRLIIPIGWTETYAPLRDRYACANAISFPEQVELTIVTPREKIQFSGEAPRRKLDSDNENEHEKARERFALWKMKRAQALRLRGTRPAVSSASDGEKAESGKSSGRGSAMRVGSLVHAALEAYAEGNDFGHALQVASLREHVSAGERDVAEAILREGISGELAEKLNGARAVFSELPFTQSDAGGTKEGKIDLLIHTAEDRWILVDYKTDDVAPDAIEVRARYYVPQMQTYSCAVEKLIGRPPDERWLYFLRPKQIYRLAK